MPGQNGESTKAGRRPEIRVMVVGPFQANCYLLTCPRTRETVVVDAGADPKAIGRVVQENDLRLTTIVCTHGHVDHVGAAAALKEASGAKVWIHAGDAGMLGSPLLSLSNLLPGSGGGGARVQADGELSDGTRVPFGDLELVVRHLPGHSPGGVGFILEREPDEPSLCFSGDTLFAGSVGRTDLPGGDWNTLADSIRRVLYALPDRTVVLPGHGPETTVGREKRQNPFVTG